LRQQAHIVGSAKGKTGNNLDYFLATLDVLRSFGIREPNLERLLVMLGPIRVRDGLGRMAGGPAKAIAGWPRRPVLRLAAVKRFTHRSRLGFHRTPEN
jgi:hypothetical protein